MYPQRQWSYAFFMALECSPWFYIGRKEPHMIFIPSVDMRHNLMWYMPTRKIQNIRSSRVIRVWKKFLGMNATELENSCSVLKKHD